MKGMSPYKPEEIPLIEAALKRNRHGVRDICLFKMQEKTGYRISELLSLCVEDVWEKGRIREEITVDKRFMKRKKRSRSVILPDSVKPYLIALLDSYQVGLDTCNEEVLSMPLFPSQKGKALSRVQAYCIFESARRSAGITGKRGTHGVRKKNAMDFYAASGKDIIATQEHIGHASVKTTQRYLGADPDEIRRIQRGL